MTIALTVVLNVAAVAMLPVLLTATMRLRYHFPSTPRAGRVDTRAKHRLQRRRQAQPAGHRSSDRRDVAEPAFSR